MNLDQLEEKLKSIAAAPDEDEFIYDLLLKSRGYRGRSRRISKLWSLWGVSSKASQKRNMLETAKKLGDINDRTETQ